MPVIDPLSIPASVSEKPPVVIASKRITWRLRQRDSLLPLTERHRDGLFFVLFVATVVCFWGPLSELYTFANQQEHYSHILLIPLISLYAFYVDRVTILSSREWSPIIGLCLVSVGAVLAWRSETGTFGADTLSAQMLSFVMICWGLFLLFYGLAAFRTVSFGLLFLLCMVPLPAAVLNAVIVFLQRNSAEATDVVFNILGIPYYRDGFVFALPNLSIHIAEECSGIRSTLSLIITSLVAGHFFLRSLWAKFALVMVVVPLAIIKNAFRIVGLSLLANYVDRSFITDSVLHRFGGIPLFVLSLLVLGLLAWLLRSLEKRMGYPSFDASHART